MDEIDASPPEISEPAEYPDILQAPEISETQAMTDSPQASEIPETSVESAGDAAPRESQSQVVSPEMAAFATEFHELNSGMKGGWGERVVLSEMDAQNQVPILDHWDEPTRQGFDAVSFDPTAGVIHIWEVKNWDGTVGEKALTAWTPERLEPNQVQILASIPDGLAHEQVAQALQEGRVEYHLRLGPETQVTAALAELIIQQNFSFRVDVASFTPETMLAYGSGKG